MPALSTNVELIDAARRNCIPLIAVAFKDQLPSHIRKYGGYIINLQNKGEGNGTHWTALFVQNKQVIYFDSFGFAPPELVKMFARQIDPSVVYNKKQIQNVESGVCGYYVLYFLYFMSHTKGTIHQKFQRFLNMWSDDPQKNRTLLERYIKPLA